MLMPDVLGMTHALAHSTVTLFTILLAACGVAWQKLRTMNARGLLIEDDPDVVELIAGYFKKHSEFTIAAERDGAAGLSHARNQTPAAVILDLMLPKMNAKRENGLVKLNVSDDGVGIPPADLPRIFERFYCADKARSRDLGGTGLGLSIVKHIAQLHGGKVEAQSTLGKGTTISVFLPIARNAAERAD